MFSQKSDYKSHPNHCASRAFRDGKKLTWLKRLGKGDGAGAHLVELKKPKGKAFQFVLREVS